jgi:hypothetical protein
MLSGVQMEFPGKFLKPDRKFKRVKVGGSQAWTASVV